MQTFLPYPDFKKSAECLDYRRLGKQRVETWQLINAIAGLTKGWQNHPAAKMWAGNIQALANYGICVCDEWIGRGYNDSMRSRFVTILSQLGVPPGHYAKPHWFDSPIHASHRSNLLRKDYSYYSKFGWQEPSDLPYYWPKGII